MNEILTNLALIAQLIDVKQALSIFYSAALIIFLVACTKPNDVVPSAPERPAALDRFGQSRIDEFNYLEDINDIDTQNYLASEQIFSQESFDIWLPLRREISKELNQLLPAAKRDNSVQLGSYYYWREVVSGAQYPIFFRRAVERETVGAASKQIVLDVNELADGHSYYALGDFSVSPDGRWVAFTEDTAGAEHFNLRVREISTGRELSVPTTLVDASLAWLAHNSLYYVVNSLDGSNVMRLNPFSAESYSVYREDDPSFNVDLRLSRDGNFLVLTARNPVSTEILLVDKAGIQKMISPRRMGHHYQVRVAEGHVYILSNLRQPDFEVARFDLKLPDQWSYFETPPGTIKDFEVFADGLVLLIEERFEFSLFFYRASGEASLLLKTAPIESIRLSSNPNLYSNLVRFVRYGPHLSDQTEEIDLITGELKILALKPKRKIPSRIARLEWYEARDGTQIPMTWLQAPDRKTKMPVLVTVYGAYGISQTRSYQLELQPLLDRDFAVANLYVRGGGELGPRWHEAGRLQLKMNGINDFIDGVDYLAASEAIDPRKIFVRGVSAGAVIVAAALNRRPELFAGVILRYPFLDLVGTLDDQSASLTPSDILEWGNPSDGADLKYLLSYSPYEQIKSQKYPSVMLTVAKPDTRVSMAESLKWLAKIRANDLGSAEKFIYIIETGGHFGPSDQYEKKQLVALEYAFVLTRP